MLEVAEHVFSARGWQAATMDEIADLVGVTKPLIYDYFGSKEGLFAATIERARGQLLAALIQAWETDPDVDVRQRLEQVVVAFFRFIDDREQAFTLLRTEGAVVGAETSASVERSRQQTAKAFADGMRTNPQFAAVPASRLTGMAEILIGGCERLAVWRAEQHRMSPEAAAELIMATLWDGLASVGRAAS
jgi:AcrR family transcriptional regulator